MKIPIAVYEKEPSSVIAYTLSSREYARELVKLQSMDKGGKKSFTTSNKAEELGSALTETTINVTSTSPSNTGIIDATVGGKCNVAIAKLMGSYNAYLHPIAMIVKS